MNLHWFLSATVRQATHMWKHVHKLVCAQRDLLSAEALAKIDESIAKVRRALRAKANKAELESRMVELEQVANTWLRPFPQAAIRENVEVLLVAIAVAMAIRTFIAQPFKIPTGSMQPTLFGVTSNPDFQRFESYRRGDGSFGPEPDFEIPNLVKRFFMFWFTGIGYNQIIAKADGELSPGTQDNPTKFLLFNLKQDIVIGGVTHTAWFPPEKFLQRAGLIDPLGRITSRTFKKGQEVVKLKSISGDHLFVDRLTYNFRRPQRGEIIVFETRNIPLMPDNQLGQFYIKRLVGLGGEQIRIGDDRHLVINGQRLDSTTAHFEGVYSFDPGQPAKDSHFSGHLNDAVASALGYPNLAPLFPRQTNVVTLPPNHYMVMGDNTVNSFDSRGWGSFPGENVIGRSFFVYWPIGAQENRASRFGWGNR